MSRWRMLLYKLLTQAILILGWFRDWLIEYQTTERPAGRVFDVYEFEKWSCCDCGLVHDFRAFDAEQTCDHKPDPSGRRTIGHTWPRRPKGYDYRLRWLAGKPSLAEDVRDDPVDP